MGRFESSLTDSAKRVFKRLPTKSAPQTFLRRFFVAEKYLHTYNIHACYYIRYLKHDTCFRSSWNIQKKTSPTWIIGSVPNLSKVTCRRLRSPAKVHVVRTRSLRFPQITQRQLCLFFSRFTTCIPSLSLNFKSEGLGFFKVDKSRMFLYNFFGRRTIIYIYIHITEHHSTQEFQQNTWISCRIFWGLTFSIRRGF